MCNRSGTDKNVDEMSLQNPEENKQPVPRLKVIFKSILSSEDINWNQFAQDRLAFLKVVAIFRGPIKGLEIPEEPNITFFSRINLFLLLKYISPADEFSFRKYFWLYSL
jgi:hypothetical protein